MKCIHCKCLAHHDISCEEALRRDRDYYKAAFDSERKMTDVLVKKWLKLVSIWKKAKTNTEILSSLGEMINPYA